MLRRKSGSNFLQTDITIKACSLLLALLPSIFLSLAGMGMVALEMAASSAITAGSFRLTLGAGVGPMLYGKLHDKSERVMDEYWAKQPPQRKQVLY